MRRALGYQAGAILLPYNRACSLALLGRRDEDFASIFEDPDFIALTAPPG